MTIKKMWRPLKNTLKKVVIKHQDEENAKVINDELDKISTYKTDDERINQMVTILEEEYIGVKIICEWFVEVLKDEDMKKAFTIMGVDDAIRRKLIEDIEKKIKEIDPGPVPKKR